MSVLCSSCGKVHDSKEERLACDQEHGGMRHTTRWNPPGMGEDVQQYLGERLHYVARHKLREPRPHEELDFDEAA